MLDIEVIDAYLFTYLSIYRRYSTNYIYLILMISLLYTSIFFSLFLGSKAKFINHSTTPNCEIRIVLIACEHRIGLYAKQNISSGEELCFDYGYKRNGSKSFIPVWTENSKDNDFLI